MAIGITTLQFRFAHLVVDNALVNGRVVQLQSPSDGRIKEWYARPGVVIPAGQMLAQIEQSSQNEQTLLQLTGDLQLNQAQLVTANQALTQLKTQMQHLESQRQAFQKSDVVETDSAVAEHEAAVEVAQAQANAARDEHERYARLLSEGADSPLRVEQLRSIWEAASATLKQEQATLQSALAASNAAKQGVPNQSVATNLLQQRNQLTQAAQTQSTLIRTLETQLKTNQQRLQQARSLQSDRQKLSLTAPFKGVIYNADHEQGEAIVRTQPLLTLLDCNEIWVEVIVSANEASTIDSQAPVRVQFVGSASPVVGKVDLIQPISSMQQIEEHPRLTQSVAILPVIPMNLIGQPIARITVKIPPPPQYNQAQQFCGVGQAVQLTFQRKSS
jgi:membrane fusion protein, multidrug efflux system